MTKRRVVITGIGIISTIGQSQNEFWQHCLEGKTVVAGIPDHWRNYFSPRSSVWSPLPDIDYTIRGITRTERAQNDPVTLLATAAALESLSNGRLVICSQDKRQNTFVVQGIDSARAGVFVGTGIGGAHSLLLNHSNHLLDRPLTNLQKDFRIDSPLTSELQHIADYLRYPDRFSPFVVAMTMPNAVSARLGIKFSLTGANQTSTVACAAGTVAIGRAFRAIQSGTIDIAIAGGSEYLYDHHGAIFRGFDVARTLAHANYDPEKVNRPFDRNRSGFLFSEGGAAILVLEEYHHALERNAPIVAELLGFSESFDAFSMMSMAPDGIEIERMIRGALADACIDASEVQYVNAHGTGTELNDSNELEVLSRIFDDLVLINSTKSLLGHTIGASGAIEAAATILSIKNQTTHICANLDEPIANLNFVDSVMDREINVGLTHSFAFGGHNAGLVIGRYPSNS